MNEHKAELRRLRKELREIEGQIAESIAETVAWQKLLNRQSQLHWRIVTELLLERCESEREAEQRRQREQDCDGEEWKGSDQ